METKEFDINKVKSQMKQNRTVTCRITKQEFEWIKENRISATKLFRYFLSKVMTSEIKNKSKGK